ncbi:anaerobic ribonucleoside-triphosphate reductase activating protein [Candidatus Falkowbacteria bacterium HGW-Falkowbacteria-1]|jgi:pyruvate formate lyase activating enzyme|uniref:Anaerobic ribonucleoside-triphosphate reductase activating protein n=1 Tax=Candidatus Falkowbacteria bacterium HGW-Falkowbacteria-1 TaxID=2013768 RepID=A0A2N2E8R3_9BACT|nr:MAG: anaerobic ribonucleoside-triphosphate reductase activating protein [Candidatus Falkowbacteria bacterium HGW-Falkowbacteria-1]
MTIGGIEKLSLIDFPGYLSAVIFTKSCNFRCHFCYNPMLVFASGESELMNIKDESSSLIPEEDFFLFLKDRIGKLDGIVISGGEPTLQGDLKDFIIKVKNLGYKIKLDTNGTNPDKVLDLITSGLLDYIAMDLKAPFDSYEKVVNVKTNIEKIKKSVKILIEGSLPYEFRTTVVPGLLDKEDILKMSKDIMGANLWYLQKFKSDIDLVNNNFKNLDPLTDSEMKEMVKIGSRAVKECLLRV